MLVTRKTSGRAVPPTESKDAVCVNLRAGNGGAEAVVGVAKGFKRATCVKLKYKGLALKN